MASIINASSTGSGGIVQTADASGVLQLQSNGVTALSTSGANVTIAGTLTAAAQSISKASLPTGSVLQVVNATNSTNYSGIAGAEVALFNFSITPQYSTSKIALIIAFQAGVYGAYDNYALAYRLRRGTTTSGTLVQYSRYGMYMGGGTSTNRELYVSNSFVALDSPATTSAQSYCFTVANIDGSPGYFVNNGGVTNILMMEIAA